MRLSWIVKCPVCEKEFHIAGLGAHLAQKHNARIQDYVELDMLLRKYIGEVIAPKYRGRSSPRKGKTWEELYGPERAEELKEKLRERNRRLGIFCELSRGDKNPMANPEVRTRWEKVVKSEEYRKRKSEIQRRKMSDNSYKEWWYKRYIEKTYGAITKVAEKLRAQGYRVIPLHHGYPVPDIIAIKDGRVYAVEVVSSTEQINPNKYNRVTFYDDIWWIVYRGEESGQVP
jgi:hypothetical protein